MDEFFDNILSCKEAAKFEAEFFAGDSSKEFAAIDRAGAGIAKIVLREFGKTLKQSPRVLVLSGSGHNGADAIRAGIEILKALPESEICLYISKDLDELKPNTRALARELLGSFGRVRLFAKNPEKISGKFDLMIDGLAGMSFAPPAREGLKREIEIFNGIESSLKVAVDLPSGVCDFECETALRADLTCMAGIAKLPLFNPKNAKFAGRLRYVDLGFFPEKRLCGQNIIARLPAPLKKLRRAATHKNDYGELFIFAGSENFCGAALMNAKAALRSGAGLVRAFLPESFCAAAAAAEPACIWVPCSLDESGSLALENFSAYKAVCGRESAVLMGSGLGRSTEPQALMREILRHTKARAVLDADAVCGEILECAPRGRTLITPHVGEFSRLKRGLENSDLLKFSRETGVCLLLKDYISKVCDGERVFCNTRGSPILSRAGSGDVLAGLCAGLAARLDLNLSLSECAAAAAFIAGAAAESAFSNAGESLYSTSEIFKYLGDFLDE